MTDKRGKTQIIIATIGVIGVLGAAVIANLDKILPKIFPGSGGVISNASPSPSAAITTPTGQTVSGGCFSAFAQGVRRVVPIEAGESGVQVFASDETKEQPFILRLEKRQQFKGAVKLRLHPNGRIFMIDAIVDAQCNGVEDYRIPNHGSKSTVPSVGYEIQMPSLDGGFAVRCDYEHGLVTAKFHEL